MALWGRFNINTATYQRMYSHYKSHCKDEMGITVPIKRHLYPDSKVHWANMGPTWVLSTPVGPHVSRMNLAIRVYISPTPTDIPNLLHQSVNFTFPGYQMCTWMMDVRVEYIAMQFIILNICTETTTFVHLLLLTSMNKAIDLKSAEASALGNYLEVKSITGLHSRSSYIHCTPVVIFLEDQYF